MRTTPVGIAATLAFAAAAGCSAAPQGPYGTFSLAPDATLDGAGSNVDSLAFYEAPDPHGTLLFVTAKDNQRVEVWRFPFAGHELPALAHASFGERTQVNGVAVDPGAARLYVAVSSPVSSVSVFSLPQLAFVKQLGARATDLGSEPNLALLRRPDGARWVYVSSDREVRAYDADTGEERARFEPGFGIETIVADERAQVLYVPDENGGTGVHAFDPLGAPHRRGGSDRFGGDVFQEDAEGIALYRCGASAGRDDGSGFLVVSDQRSARTEFEIFDRESWRHLGALTLDGVENTDGVASTERPLPGNPDGLFAAIDDDTSTAVVGWHRIFAASGLRCGAGAGAGPVR
jgi:hypothetical protein